MLQCDKVPTSITLYVAEPMLAPQSLQAHLQRERLTSQLISPNSEPTALTHEWNLGCRRTAETQRLGPRDETNIPTHIYANLKNLNQI